jgi:hypothetical protein
MKFESLRRWGFIIGTGIFATTLSQPGLLDVPIRNVLKNELGVPPHQMAAFYDGARDTRPDSDIASPDTVRTSAVAIMVSRRLAGAR